MGWDGLAWSGWRGPVGLGEDDRRGRFTDMELSRSTARPACAGAGGCRVWLGRWVRLFARAPRAHRTRTTEEFYHVDVQPGCRCRWQRLRPDGQAAAHEAGLLSLTLSVSRDQVRWHLLTFEGESAAYVDRQAAAYLAQHGDLSVQLDDDTTRWDIFPRTFRRVLDTLMQPDLLMQAETA